ncbi:MAG: NFACT RNA binding domain-containing protein [Candidatus Halalkalibacterium sp. M3_1C_030]
MNNYYTLIYLNRELNEKIRDGIFNFSISPHKDVLEIYIQSNEREYRLIFSTNPNETALFLDKYRPPKKSNVIEFFQELEGLNIERLSLAEKDRLMYIYFKGGKHLLFKLYGGNPNVYLVEDETIIDAFKNPEEVKGQEPPEPHAPSFADDITAKAKPKNQITKLNPLLPRNLLPYLIEQHRVDDMAVPEVKDFVSTITEALENDPHPRVLETGDFCLWSQEILDMPNDAQFDTVNRAVLHAYRNAVHLRRLHNKKQNVVQLLDRITSKKEAQLEQLRQADKSLERADEYEKFGHLLMANAHRSLDYGEDAIELDDFYEENESVEIPLKEGLSIAENAEYYYDKAKSSRKSYKEAKKRIPAVKEEAELSNRLLEEVKDIQHLPELESWMKEHSDKLEKFGYGVDEDSQASSPYRKFKEGKYEIWIGKSAKSNDELTSLAHKEDIWLHARGVSGSHVVIRMGNRKDYPPKQVILKAAGYAAYYSKAKGMEMAPVMYTKRKYVRKPKGAAPGAVVVERENVEMVPPLNPKNS